MNERFTMSLWDDDDTVFVYDRRAGWFMEKPDEREATVTEDELLRQVTKLREQLQAVTRERDKALADAQGVVNVLGFFASCIKSGEQWTPQCDDMLHAAFAHRNKK